jgi:tetratricopeptide (TPR) repeat protein
METGFGFEIPRALMFRAAELAGTEEEAYGTDLQLEQALSMLAEAKTALKAMPFLAKLCPTYDYYTACIANDEGNYQKALGNEEQAVRVYTKAAQTLTHLLSDTEIVLQNGAPLTIDYFLESLLLLASNQKALFELTGEQADLNVALEWLHAPLQHKVGPELKAKLFCKLAELYTAKNNPANAVRYARQGLLMAPLDEALKAELFSYLIEAM